MFLIVGLGNPGDLYKCTRHNAGFMAADFISSHYSFSWGHKSKFNAELASGKISDHEVILCKPATFMNLSGQAVASVISYYKIERKNIIVIHDDIDIKFADIRCKIGGGTGGHNGLKSIDKHIGSEYLRIRLGVGRPANQEYDIASYVLNNFSAAELLTLNSKYAIICQNMHVLLSYGYEKFKTEIARG